MLGVVDLVVNTLLVTIYSRMLYFFDPKTSCLLINKEHGVLLRDKHAGTLWPNTSKTESCLLNLQPTFLWVFRQFPPRVLASLLLVVPTPAATLVSFGAWRYTSQRCCTPGTFSTASFS